MIGDGAIIHKSTIRRLTAISIGLLSLTTMSVATPADPPPLTGQSTAPSRPGEVLGFALDSVNSATTETTAGNLIADAVREAARSDVSLIPADEIVDKQHLDAGAHSTDDMLGLLTFRNDATDSVTVLTITGKQLRAALERSVSREPEPFDGFLQMSGIQIKFAPAKPVGSRIIDASIDGVDIADTGHYTVATTHSAANGSFGYFRLWDRTAITGGGTQTVAEALTAYIAGHPNLSPLIGGRIVGL